MKNISTVTINGIVYEGKVDLVQSLIDSGLITPVESTPVETPKTESKPKSKGKGKSKAAESVATPVSEAESPKVLYTNKNGLQFIKPRDYTNSHMADYKAMSEEMYGTPIPPKAHRADVYKALGWII